MIDWVMPPQTAVALYIYRVGRSCPARNPFTARNSQGLLNSTRTRGPPVRPVRPTGQTGVAVAGSATRRPTGQIVEVHQSDRWRQPDPPCANFGCEQLASHCKPSSSIGIAKEVFFEIHTVMRSKSLLNLFI
jgi:hypothetical protein